MLGSPPFYYVEKGGRKVQQQFLFCPLHSYILRNHAANLCYVLNLNDVIVTLREMGMKNFFLHGITHVIKQKSSDNYAEKFALQILLSFLYNLMDNFDFFLFFHKIFHSIFFLYGFFRSVSRLFP
jgi:hypothetical protein